jgi:hypothetical protein
MMRDLCVPLGALALVAALLGDSALFTVCALGVVAFAAMPKRAGR